MHCFFPYLLYPLPMPIIDAHVHIGSWRTIEESQHNLLESMNRRQVALGVLSNADCSSFPGEAGAYATPLSSVEGLRQIIAFARENPGRFALLVWIKPLLEPYPSEELLSLVEENRDLIVGLKLHPFCERISPCDPALEPYYEWAEKEGWPILCHTALDFHSSIGELIAAAKAHPRLSFVAAHLELGSTHRYAIEAIRPYPNIYADTAWVDFENANFALDVLGEDRVLFGTDNPLDGSDTLFNPMYDGYFHHAYGEEGGRFDALMYQNALSLYRIKTN